jgi:alpha-tubulin suppressor-like RCC1 family protein
MVMTPHKIFSQVSEIYAVYSTSTFLVGKNGVLYAFGRDKYGNLGDGCAATDAANAPDVCDVGTPKVVTPF